MAKLRRMKTLILFLLLALFLACSGPVAAQPASPPVTNSPAASPPASSDEARHLVETLENDGARAKLIQDLRALIAVEHANDEEVESAPPSLLDELSERMNTIGTDTLDALSVLLDAPKLLGWFENQIDNPQARARWIDLGVKLGSIFGAALLGEWGVRALLIRPRRALVFRASDRLGLRLLLIFIRFVTDALPILVFAGAAYGMMTVVRPPSVAMVFVFSYLAARTILAFARRLLLLGPNGESRHYLYVWTRRFVSWSAFGYAVTESSRSLGVPVAVQALLLKAVIFVLAGLAVVFVLRNRRIVADWLRGGDANGHGRSGWQVLRRWLAEAWHILAIAYILGMFGVFALHINGGFPFFLRATGLSIAALLAARILVALIKRSSRRGFGFGAGLKARLPTLEARVLRYHPVAMAAAAGVIYALALVAVLEIWNVPSVSWFETPLGKRLSGQLLTVSGVIAGALFFWEVFSAMIEHYLAGMGGAQRSARARTLLPLMRTGVTVVVAIMASLMVLSELGVNIAPLLAGAGVVGVAVGFGSQALVKDFITGLFILLEDTLAVGDVVDLGKGHAGVVETISIRTIRLRDVAGTLHAIPFSEVSTVSNMTKGYSYFVANVAVSYREDIDNVIQVMRDVAAELAADPEFKPFILEPLEILGLDKMLETGVLLQARMKTQPRRQWVIGREFNRRLKNTFDRLGIEMPYSIRPAYLADRDVAQVAAEAG